MKSLIVSVAILGVVGLAVGTGAGAVDVTATATPQLVSINMPTTSIGYGFVGIPSVDNETTAPSANVILSVENTGNVDEDFLIKGSNAAFGGGGSVTWTIVDGAPGGASTHNYNHKFVDCGVGDSTCTTEDAANNMTTTSESLSAGVSAGSIDYFRLKLSTPTETGGDLTEHTTTVTVTAVAS